MSPLLFLCARNSEICYFRYHPSNAWEYNFLTQMLAYENFICHNFSNHNNYTLLLEYNMQNSRWKMSFLSDIFTFKSLQLRLSFKITRISSKITLISRAKISMEYSPRQKAHAWDLNASRSKKQRSNTNEVKNTLFHSINPININAL